MTYCLGDISILSSWILLDFCWVDTLGDILIFSISWSVSDTPINHNLITIVYIRGGLKIKIFSACLRDMYLKLCLEYYVHELQNLNFWSLNFYFEICEIWT